MILWYPPILVYHRVHPELGSESPTISPEIFKRQMAILAKRWRPTPLLELVACLKEGSLIPHRTVVVTFDDGTEDNFLYAYPILLEYKIPATVYMITGNMGMSGYLKKEQILQMSHGGITFGSHTEHHTYLPSLPMTHVRRELIESKQSLESLGLSIQSMSYPGGGFSSDILPLVRELGYQAACTTNRGIRRQPIDPWALRRITMHAQGTFPFGIWLRCSGYYGLNRRLRAPA